MYKEKFENFIFNNFSEKSEEIMQKFAIFCDFLLNYNKNVNLTAITEADLVYDKHFYDSICLSKMMPQNSTLIDVGAGAGFPGLAIAIVRDDIKVTLVDSLAKRVKFLNMAIDMLNLKNVCAIHSRAEDLAQRTDFRENFDICTARAVAFLPTLCEYCLPFVKIGGSFLAFKGTSAPEEILKSKMALSILGAKFDKMFDYNIFSDDIKRFVVKIDKTNITPLKYPRNQNKPSSNPL